MFISSTAFLPSSTSLYLTLLAYGAWFRGEFRLAVFAVALSALLSKLTIIRIRKAFIGVEKISESLGVELPAK